MREVQKFRRGDLVVVPNEEGHFMTGEAIVMGSYADQFGFQGNSTLHDYTLMFTASGGSVSWFREEEMVLKWYVGEEGIQRVIDERDRRDALEMSVEWIARNWNHRPSGATTEKLMSLIGITNPWGARGEGITYYSNSSRTMMFFAPLLDKKTPEERLVILKALETTGKAEV